MWLFSFLELQSGTGSDCSGYLVFALQSGTASDYVVI